LVHENVPLTFTEAQDLDRERAALYNEVYKTLEQRLTPTEREVFLAKQLTAALDAFKNVRGATALVIAEWLLSPECEIKVPPALKRAVAVAIREQFESR
jgi:hypothetical protein